MTKYFGFTEILAPTSMKLKHRRGVHCTSKPIGTDDRWSPLQSMKLKHRRGVHCTSKLNGTDDQWSPLQSMKPKRCRGVHCTSEANGRDDQCVAPTSMKLKHRRGVHCTSTSQSYGLCLPNKKPTLRSAFYLFYFKGLTKTAFSMMTLVVGLSLLLVSTAAILSTTSMPAST